MPSHDPRVDAYIERQAVFAQTILVYVRELVHEACPDVEETIKWGMPTFVDPGGILCGMAGFKQHASFGFWKHALVVGDDQPRVGMGSYGKLKTLDDLPPRPQLLAHVHKAMALNAGRSFPADRAQVGSRETGSDDATRSRQRAGWRRNGEDGVRWLSAGPAARVHRLDHRRQAR